MKDLMQNIPLPAKLTMTFSRLFRVLSEDSRRSCPEENEDFALQRQAFQVSALVLSLRLVLPEFIFLLETCQRLEKNHTLKSNSQATKGFYSYLNALDNFIEGHVLQGLEEQVNTSVPEDAE